MKSAGLVRNISSSKFTSCQARSLSFTANRKIHGVFPELVRRSAQVPWIETLQRRKDAALGRLPAREPLKRDMTPKKVSDTYHRVVLPLGQDPWLSDTYLNSTGNLRLGPIFSDLDALSGFSAYKLTGSGVTVVTAAFDRIAINCPLEKICDLELSSRVTYVGRTSMEVRLQVARASPSGTPPFPDDVLLNCQCTMVGLDPDTRKTVQLPPLITETDEEKTQFEEGVKNSQQRKQNTQRSLLKTKPDDEETNIIHALWQKQISYRDPNIPDQKPNNVQFMDATKLSTTSIMQPQYRNFHQDMIFGGFLLKQTYELAFCCAASFARKRPKFISLDPSTFENPVPVGSVLYLTAMVVYTSPPIVVGSREAEVAHTQAEQAYNAEGSTKPDKFSKAKQTQTRVQVRVKSRVRNVEHGDAKSTGDFHYTFLVDADVKVLPRTYTEFMLYIDARRSARMVGDGVQDERGWSREEGGENVRGS
ncbi:acyl-coenzyme A thioesterase 9 [Piedraia hortae CBS 480.64]|uniref:Acyl-coenzyme A thioesterase 9 n=1 Tax=Piedraia hortae CBS 480.64 TaxID=1314780 RepID=A0A6A7C938_9PEZI|nr:acyl-coenzyme A thioesterase 9 [Piedraia hortae CBS 480.64]